MRLSEDGERAVVSDGGVTMARRSLFGIESFSKSAQTLWDDIVTDFGVETVSDRVFARGPVQAMPHLIGLVADAAVALDSVRHLTESARFTFTEKLERWLSKEAGLKIKETRHVTDRLGEEQRVTAIVSSPRGEILVQGAGGKTPSNIKQSAEHAYFVFSGLDRQEWSLESRLIVLERLAVKTDQQMRAAKGLVARLAEEAYVGTFESQLSLNRFLTETAPGERDMATQTYGQASAD